MDISIFGLGYVGVVSAACLASQGHTVTGVDVNPVKVDMLGDGRSPIIEDRLPDLLAEGVRQQRLHGTTDQRAAIKDTELSLICVGTPSNGNGSLDTRFLEEVCRDIAVALRDKKDHHLLVFRSTMLPGTMRNKIIPLLEEVCGKKHGEGFSAVFNPEFLRESTAVSDFFSPPKTVVGSDSEEVTAKVMSLYEKIPGIKVHTTIEVAEMVKYVDNNFHAVKITFANEIGQLCKQLGLDSHVIMDIFAKDTKLNISPYYLKPGFAFGGSCLPKDLRAITYLAKTMDLDTPLLNSLLHSNEMQVHNTVRKIMAYGKKKIGIAGFSFKAGTDDLRESPVVEMIETLLGKGYDLKIYDRNVSLARLIGANREYINNHIPHISSLMADSLDDLIRDREIIVIGNRDPEFRRLLDECHNGQLIFDLVRIGENMNATAQYEGICW